MQYWYTNKNQFFPVKLSLIRLDVSDIWCQSGKEDWISSKLFVLMLFEEEAKKTFGK